MMKCTLVAVVPTEVLLLPAHDLWVMDKKLRDDFVEFCIRVPDEPELKQMYFKIRKWNKYKQ